MIIEIDKYLILSNDSIKKALQTLQDGGLGIGLLVDNDGKFLRTVTDGDIRRLLIKAKKISDPISVLDEVESVFIKKGCNDNQVLELMNQYDIDHIPEIDEENKPTHIHHRRYLNKKIQLSIPHIGDNEKMYVQQAFDTNWIAPLGPNVDAFEQEISDYVGCKSAAATVSGTSAIHLALRLLNVQAEDIVLCSDFTFVASAAPIVYQAATPIFIDSEMQSWNMCPIALRNALEALREKNKKPKAIILVHLYGVVANMEAICKIATEFDVPIIEDAAESLGSTYHGNQSGTFGKYGIFSFNGNKIITTSGGGMLISNDEQNIQKARYLSTQAKEPAPYYEHTEIGYNYRMSNVLAGIGRGQLQVLDQRVQARRAVFDCYKKELSHIDAIDWMPEPEGVISNRWLTTATINPNKSSVTAQELIKKLAEQNIEARHTWKPMHMQPVFAECEFFGGSKEQKNSRYLFDNGICLPSASSMTKDEQKLVIKSIKECF